jgi:PadR family transcriptional regulator PadR
MARSPLDLLPGTVDVLILRTLGWDAMHGYGIARFIRDRSNGAIDIESAALYQALHRLERKRLVKGSWGVSDNNRRARFYDLTAEGKRQLRVECQSLYAYVDALFAVLKPA